MDNLAQNQYDIDIKRFPVLPDEIKDESLFFLKLQILDQPLNSQRNFFMYLMMADNADLYERFIELWKEENLEELEKISPVC